MEKNEIKPGRNGLPPKKKDYTNEEKTLLVSKAAEFGTHTVADAYGMDWHRIASWKKYYGGSVKFKNASKEPVFIIQSPNGQEITYEEIKSRIGAADKIYVRADEGKAYWVRDKENGSINLWQ